MSEIELRRILAADERCGLDAKTQEALGFSLNWRFFADRTPETHPIHPAVREAVLLRAKGCCESCGDEGPLELFHCEHYLTHRGDEHCPDGLPIYGFEAPSDLKALCAGCYEQYREEKNKDDW